VTTTATVAGSGSSESRGNEERKPRLFATLAGALWFPALFLIGILTCYALPFHNPTPHDLRIAVANPPVAAAIGQRLAKEKPGAFDIVPVADDAAARRAVRDRSAAAAFVPGAGHDTLYVAKAGGTALVTVATTVFTAVSTATHTPLTVVDLAPTARGDVSGIGLFYLCLAPNVVPYVTVMVMLRVVTLGRRAKLLTFVGVGAVVTVATHLFGLALHLIPNEPLAILYGFLVTQAISWTVYGLVPFVKQFLAGVAIALFVMLSLPSSGGAVPYQMVPAFFRALHPVLPLGNLVSALRSIFYFDRHGLLEPTLVLCAWFAAGALLVGAGALRQRALERRAGGAEGEATAELSIEDPAVAAPAARPMLPGVRGMWGAGPMVSGRVRDTAGDPVAGVLVTMLTPGGSQLVRTRTDGEGRYGATGLPEDSTTVVLLAPGYAPAATRVFVEQGRPVRQDFVLVAAADATTSRATANGAPPA
jgi:hypothetical protein